MNRQSWLVLGAIGLVAGLINGLIGIGGGTILIPAMVFFLGCEQHRAHGTSLAIVLPTSLVSAFIYYRQGVLELMPLLGLALATSVGAVIGAMLMNLCRPGLLRRIFALFMFGTGLYMLF